LADRHRLWWRVRTSWKRLLSLPRRAFRFAVASPLRVATLTRSVGAGLIDVGCTPTHLQGAKCNTAGDCASGVCRVPPPPVGSSSSSSSSSSSFKLRSSGASASDASSSGASSGASSTSDTQHRCQCMPPAPPTCSDRVKNGNEVSDSLLFTPRCIVTPSCSRNCYGVGCASRATRTVAVRPQAAPTSVLWCVHGRCQCHCALQHGRHGLHSCLLASPSP
jgi:hypothetical protein